MPLERNGVYKLTDLSGLVASAPSVAIDPKVREMYSPELDASVPFILYLVDNPISIGHSLAYQYLADSPDSTDVLDLARSKTAGGDVIWRFERLTVPLWKGMMDGVGGFAELEKSLTNDYDLHVFYLAAYVEDWWLAD